LLLPHRCVCCYTPSRTSVNIAPSCHVSCHQHGRSSGTKEAQRGVAIGLDAVAVRCNGGHARGVQEGAQRALLTLWSHKPSSRSQTPGAGPPAGGAGPGQPDGAGAGACGGAACGRPLRGCGARGGAARCPPPSRGSPSESAEKTPPRAAAAREDGVGRECCAGSGRSWWTWWRMRWRRNTGSVGRGHPKFTRRRRSGARGRAC